MAVGLHITETAAKPFDNQQFIKRVITELGGKNAVVVDSDADLEEAATGIIKSAFGFQGQKCSAGSRAVIVADVYDKLLEMVVEKTKNLKIGDAKDNNISGPVINQKAVDKIMSYIETGKKEGRSVMWREDGKYRKRRFLYRTNRFCRCETRCPHRTGRNIRAGCGFN